MIDKTGKTKDALTAKLAEAEKNNNPETISKMLEIAAIHYDFIFFQAEPDRDKKKEHLIAAEEILNKIEKNADDLQYNEIILLRGKINLQKRDGQAALDCLNEYISRNPDTISALYWRAEAWHLLGKYDELRKDLADAGSRDYIPPKMIEVIDFWIPEYYKDIDEYLSLHDKQNI